MMNRAIHFFHFFTTQFNVNQTKNSPNNDVIMSEGGSGLVA